MSALRLILAWLVVVVPLGWGVSKSVQKSIPLFRRPPAATAVPAPAAVTATPMPTPPPLSKPSP